MRERIFLDIDLCCGCRSCAAACHYRYHEQANLRHAPIWEEAFEPLACLHCEQPACVAACPNEAMIKGDDEIVRRRKFMCVGCRSCALACPFGVIDQGLDYHVVAKCDLCRDRTTEGKIPRCVASCTSGALKFGKIEEVYSDDKKVLIGSRILAENKGRRR